MLWICYHNKHFFKCWISLVVQWLGLDTFPAVARVPLLVEKLRSCKLCGSAKKKKKKIPSWSVSSVQWLSHVWLRDCMDCSMPGFPVHYQLPELAQTHVHRVGDATQPSCPLSSPSPPAFNPSQHQGFFQWVSSLHQVAKVPELQLQHQSFQWIFRTDSFRMNRLDLLLVQGTLKNLLQHHSSKALVLWCSTFFIVQLSHPYMTTGKTTALTRRTFVGKVMSLLFNMLSSLVTTFLPRSKHLLISWLHSPSTVILEPPKIKSVAVSIISPSICHGWWDQMPWS